MNLNEFTLLYVEDDEHTQECMKLVLEEEFLEFYQAFNGEEALKIYEKHKPDIILTDINMPKLDGLAMAKIIKEKNPQQAIIVVSAFDDRETLLEAINMGIDGFAPKPINMNILNQKIEDVVTQLNKERKISSEKQEKIDNLYMLAHYDALTNIPNRFLFNTRLEQALSRAKRHNSSVTLFFIDLDDFKKINDTYGHRTGDIVLQTISDNIKSIIRTEDTLARIGGDEFALIIENLNDKTYIQTLAEKILEVTSRPITFENNSIAISCSVGISQFPKDCQTKEELLDLADNAMYRTKKFGKANFTYFENSKEG